MQLAEPASPGVISIHALREEGDFMAWVKDFYKLISIHALREEGDKIPWRQPSPRY